MCRPTTAVPSSACVPALARIGRSLPVKKRLRDSAISVPFDPVDNGRSFFVDATPLTLSIIDLRQNYCGVCTGSHRRAVSCSARFVRVSFWTRRLFVDLNKQSESDY